MTEESRTIRSYSLQSGGEDPAQDGVAPGIYHHLALIMVEILDQIVLIGIVVKSWKCKLLEKFTFQYALREGEI